MSTGVVPF